MNLRPTVVTDPAAPSVRVRDAAKKREARPAWSWKRFGGKFLVLSVLAHLVFLATAAYFVVEHYAGKPKQTFTPAAKGPSAASRALQHTVQSKRQKSGGAPASAKRVTTTSSNTTFALPAMPAMPNMPVSPMAMSLSGMGMGTGLGSGIGSGMGSGMGGGAGLGGKGFNVFGATGGNGLPGTFYDLKQYKDGKPNPEMAANLEGSAVPDSPPNVVYDKVVSQFIKGGMGDSWLSRFFRGPDALYATQIYIPMMTADQGPQAFNLEGKVEPKRWLVVYRGKVSPPVTGSYRFAGWADDLMVVRFNGQVVLDGSIFPPTLLRPTTSYLYAEQVKLDVGNQVNVKAGSSYPIEIVVGERPGGLFRAFLFLEKIGETYTKTADGTSILPLLKFAVGASPQEKDGTPPIAPDTAWSVWKAAPSTAAAAVFNR